MAVRTWPEDWQQRMVGEGCAMCANLGNEETAFGARILCGHFADVFLQRATPLPGYSVAIWKHGHVAEPTDLDDVAAAGYWTDVLAASRAIASVFEPAKLNFLTLGNAVPHLHTHILPRRLDDAAPGKPLPWELVATADPVPDAEFRVQLDRLRQVLAA